MSETKYIIWAAWAEDSKQQDELTQLGEELGKKFDVSHAIAGQGEGWWSYKGTENPVSASELQTLINTGEIEVKSVLRVHSRKEGGELASMFDSVIKVAEEIKQQ